MKIKDIIGISNAKLIYGSLEENLDFKYFSKDSRKINKNDIFIGIKGENFDGNDYYLEAFNKGAKTCILEKEILNPKIITNKNLIIVDNMETFLVTLAKMKKETLHIPFIAITGSVGKTSTKNIIASTLAIKYKVLKTSGNLNTMIGLALTILGYHNEEIAVIEMGMNQKGEIKRLTNFVKPDVAIITNVGTAHIGNLGSRENILRAKLEILDGLKGPLIINNDNDLLHEWYKEAKIKNKIITYGINTTSDYRANNITYDKLGSHYKLNNENITINVLGTHFIYNSLVAFIIGKMYQIPHDKIKANLLNIPLEANRMEIITTNNITIINDSYNASYDSIYYALVVLSTFKGRKIAVLGDINELGNFSQEIHEKVGDLIIKNNIDILITSGDYSKYINKIALKNGLPTNNSYHLNNNSEIINLINKIKKDNDNILIKASNSYKYWEIVDQIK